MKKSIISALEKVSNSFVWLLAFLMLFGAIVYSEKIGFLYLDSNQEALQLSALFGDSFGFLTSVFSGLAVLLIFKTYQVQKKELKNALDTLRESKELNNSQAFENTFYKLLELHQRNQETIHQVYMQGEGNGFSYIYDKVVKGFRLEQYASSSVLDSFAVQPSNAEIQEVLKESSSTELKVISDRFFDRLDTYEKGLTKYVSHLILLLKFLNDSGYKHSIHADVLISLLSDEELVLLFYYAEFLGDVDSHILNELPFENVDDSMFLFGSRNTLKLMEN